MTSKHSQSMTIKNFASKPIMGSSLALLSLLPTLAFAHSGPDMLQANGSFSGSVLEGILHPLTGPDHLMLALGMGILFTQMQSFKKGFASLTIGLVVGFGLSLSVSLNSVFVESGIVLSIILLTLALLSPYFNTALNPSNNKTSVKSLHNLAIVGFGALAMFHGAAHAIEVPVNATTAGFFTGMIVAMLSLYAVGSGVATYLNKNIQNSAIIQRVMAVVGLCAVLFS